MPQPIFLLLVATVLPLVSFVILVFVGKRMGRPLAGIVGTAAIFGSFLLSIGALIAWGQDKPRSYQVNHIVYKYGMGELAINYPIDWIPAQYAHEHGGVITKFLQVGFYVDSLTIIMFLMITLVATLVHIFSIAYMGEDKRFARFFTYLGLFCFSMLGLVMGGTILQLFIFWELVGLCSYLLIGFWYEKKSASNAAIKAFVVNRVGDFGFLIGLGILFYHLGNVTLPDVWASLNVNQFLTTNGALPSEVTLPNGLHMTSTLMTIMGIGLFLDRKSVV